MADVPNSAKQELLMFEQTDSRFLEKTKGLSLSEMSPMQREWAEKREQRRKTLEARVAQEESERASHPAISSREGGNGEVDGLPFPMSGQIVEADKEIRKFLATDEGLEVHKTLEEAVEALDRL